VGSLAGLGDGWGETLKLPIAKLIDKRLVMGSLLFGAGWGLAGFCPGPALVSLVSGREKPLVFVIAMMMGMAAFAYAERNFAMQHR